MFPLPDEAARAMGIDITGIAEHDVQHVVGDGVTDVYKMQAAARIMERASPAGPSAGTRAYFLPTPGTAGALRGPPPVPALRPHHGVPTRRAKPPFLPGAVPWPPPASLHAAACTFSFPGLASQSPLRLSGRGGGAEEPGYA